MNSSGRAAWPPAFWTVTHSRHSDNVALHILRVDILTISPISH